MMMHEMDHSLVTLLYAGIMGVMLVVLSLLVSIDRGRVKVPIGNQGGDDRFARIGRAQGNLAEYLPTMVILLYLVEITGYGATWVHVLGIVFVAARLLHAAGIIGKVEPVRILGAVVNVTVISIAAVLCLVSFFGA
jgi:uncharacterized membrane protein YecN with MAPEG domain